jgi:hypothetical protein
MQELTCLGFMSELIYSWKEILPYRWYLTFTGSSNLLLYLRLIHSLSLLLYMASNLDNIMKI